MGMNALEVRRRVMLAQPHEAVASGAVASFRTDVVSALPMEFDLLPIQAGTGDPSPDNIRPISGHDGLIRNRTGKNLLPSSLPADVINATINSSNKIASATNARTFCIKCKKNTDYYISSKTSGTALTVSLGTKKPAIGDSVTGKINMVNRTGYKMSTGDNDWLILTISSASDYSGIVTKEFMIEESSTKTAYEAYTGTTKQITFPTPPGTVYGGTVTDNGDGTGTLTVCKVEFIPTSVDGTGTASTGVKYISSYLPTGMNAKEESIYNECISSEYKFRAASAPSDSGWFRVQPNIIYIFDDRFTSKATAESILASEKPQFVYELATPVTYNLSLDAIQSLIGQNHVWVDNADSVTVEYWGH